jgi:hypothetical protein
MGFSIQDYAKKINSRLSWLDCLSLLVTMLFLVAFLIFLYVQEAKNTLPVSYIVQDGEVATSSVVQDSQPFGSKKGKTYTFSWCRNSSVISDKNKIYYKDEAEALRAGKVLSKFCQK